MVDKVIQTTRDVRPANRFEFWRDMALPNVEASNVPGYDREDFGAARWMANTLHGGVISTQSHPVAIRRTARRINQDGVDAVCIQMLTAGSGFQEHAGRPSMVVPGFITISDLARPFSQTATEPYEELRIHLPREVFNAHVGGLDRLVGRVFAAGDPLVDMAAGYLRMSVDALPRMTDAQAKVMFESIVHLLRGLVGDAEPVRTEGETSPAALRSVAIGYIERRLHDPALDVAEVIAALGISRSRLYAAFAESGGVQAAIRDRRLDRAHRLLAATGTTESTILSVALACGFPDHSTFSHAFRRRFGLTPRDVLAGARAG